ncbi:hypothetical protein KY495_14880 [Massilia sp. PAMC28688]|uniref:hypothetical protein n=1 Tax=Massilia sp. PAMC28688 TaxID=2861283 RepID=UPI001C63673A|nr:hypothetical protein [Massilia sp. PAMC28688]QYF92052.1 hypothetical protein KY495_14880 [Massilia sp. PAMC28688]
MTIRHAIGSLFAVFCTLSPWLAAQESQPHGDGEAPIQSIQVNGVRDPAMLPYEAIYSMLSKVAQVSDGKVDMAIKVVSAKTMQPMPDLEVALQGDKDFEKLPSTPDGFLTVPLSQARVDDKAVFLTNKKKGSLKVEFFFVPRLPAGPLRLGDIADSIAAVRQSRKLVVPWYLRPFFPSISEVRLCYPDGKQHVTIADGTPVVRRADIEQKSYITREQMFCASFNIAEASAARDKLITLPQGFSALFH